MKNKYVNCGNMIRSADKSNSDIILNYQFLKKLKTYKIWIQYAYHIDS